MIKVLTINKEMYERYSSYVASNSQARFGHDLEWALALSETYGAKIEHLIAFEDTKVVGVCPLFFCKPIFGGTYYKTSLFPSYFGPLYDSVQVLDAILEVIRKKTSNLQYTEILSTRPLPTANVECLPYLQTPDYTYRLPLDTEINQIFGRLNRDNRRILRKPDVLEEMELIIDVEGELINEFYKMYVGIYAQKHGFIPHVRDLFHNIFSQYQNGRVRIYLAKIKNSYIGGVFTFWAHGEIYYAWSAANPNNLYHPTQFLIWKIIQDGTAQGYNWFNMGESPKNHKGLNHFKEGWCTEITEPCRYFIPGQLSNPTVRLFDRISWTKKIISHLPVGVITNFLSPAIRYFL